MAVTTGQRGVPTGARWHVLLRPRWLGWHAFVVVATVGMLLLGDWQLRRAQAGNELSWAYTFEWPLFSAFTVYFWIKSLRDELRGHGASASGSASTGPDLAATGAEATGLATAVTAPGKAAGAAASAAGTPRAAPASRKAASWDATSWDAANWNATAQEVGADVAGKPVDVARATPADGEAYVARLMAEVRGPARWRGRR